MRSLRDQPFSAYRHLIQHITEMISGKTSHPLSNKEFQCKMHRDDADILLVDLSLSGKVAMSEKIVTTQSITKHLSGVFGATVRCRGNFF